MLAGDGAASDATQPLSEAELGPRAREGRGDAGVEAEGVLEMSLAETELARAGRGFLGNPTVSRRVSWCG